LNADEIDVFGPEIGSYGFRSEGGGCCGGLEGFEGDVEVVEGVGV